jgi:hypothetical protein
MFKQKRFIEYTFFTGRADHFHNRLNCGIFITKDVMLELMRRVETKS